MAGSRIARAPAGGVEVGEVADAGDRLLPPTGPASVTDLAAYRDAGGGRGLAAALAQPPDDVIAVVERAGLRGRGGAGFPTAVKWRTVRDDPCPTTYVVCNAAEGEPGTFKDRWLLRRNPYLVLEGLAIAAHAVGAVGAFVALKRRFEPEREALTRALAEMRAAGLLAGVQVELVAGPDDYLFGEEKAMLEVIEGRPALPRLLPPYQVGLFAHRERPNPTLVNNVETLANVPRILADGAEAYRATGTPDSPGTMLMTVCGDVLTPGVYEIALGAPLSHLVDDLGGGPLQGRSVKVVLAGASAGVLVDLATPLAFDAMRAAGSGLGSGGFVVYDDSACIVEVAAVFSRFLYVESCNQCPACKQGTRRITDALERIQRGTGTAEDLDEALSRTGAVTGGTRCALPQGEAVLVRSVIERFRDEFEAHLGAACPRERHLVIPKLDDYDEAAQRFAYQGTSVRDAEPRPEQVAQEPAGGWSDG